MPEAVIEISVEKSILAPSGGVGNHFEDDFSFRENQAVARQPPGFARLAARGGRPTTNRQDSRIESKARHRGFLFWSLEAPGAQNR